MTSDIGMFFGLLAVLVTTIVAGVYGVPIVVRKYGIKYGIIVLVSVLVGYGIGTQNSGRPCERIDRSGYYAVINVFDFATTVDGRVVWREVGLLKLVREIRRDKNGGNEDGHFFFYQNPKMFFLQGKVSERRGANFLRAVVDETPSRLDYVKRPEIWCLE